MSEMGLTMDDDVKEEFNSIKLTLKEGNDKLDEFMLNQTKLCGERGTEIGVINQRLDNGDKQKESDRQRTSLEVNILRVVVGLSVLAVAIISLVQGLN